MALKRATRPLQSQLLLEMGVPADTADAYYETGTNELLFIPSGMSGSQFVYRVAWTLDALIDYLCVSDNISVDFRKSPIGDGFWICSYLKADREANKKITVSRGAPTKVDAIFEVIYELHRSKYDTETEKES